VISSPPMCERVGGDATFGRLKLSNTADRLGS
jgi:hypothetical protein